PVQLLNQLRQQFCELAGHYGKIEVELLGRVDLLLVGALRRHFEELDAFDLQLLRQDEGDPPVPGQAELSGPLAARDVGAYILAVERMAPVEDDGLRRLP